MNIRSGRANAYMTWQAPFYRGIGHKVMDGRSQTVKGEVRSKMHKVVCIKDTVDYDVGLLGSDLSRYLTLHSASSVYTDRLLLGPHALSHVVALYICDSTLECTR